MTHQIAHLPALFRCLSPSNEVARPLPPYLCPSWFFRGTCINNRRIVLRFVHYRISPRKDAKPPRQRPTQAQSLNGDKIVPLQSGGEGRLMLPLVRSGSVGAGALRHTLFGRPSIFHLRLFQRQLLLRRWLISILPLQDASYSSHILRTNCQRQQCGQS